MPMISGSQDAGLLPAARDVPRGLHWPHGGGLLGALLEHRWLASLYPLGRSHGLRSVELSLEPEGALRLLLNGLTLTPEQLEALAGGTHRLGEDGLWVDGARLSRLLESVPNATLDLYQRPRQWRLNLAAGTWLGRPTPFTRPRPPARADSHALRLSLFPDAADGGSGREDLVALEVLLEQARMLALLVPGLEVTLRAPRLSLSRTVRAAHGLVQRVGELTYGRRTLLSQPVLLAACWQGLRARCAVQWTVDGHTRIEAYVDGERAGLGDPATTVLTHTLRAGLQLHTRQGLDAFPPQRVLRGLHAVVALDRLRMPQCQDRVRGSVRAADERSGGPAFLAEAVQELAPQWAEALGCHPERARLMGWLGEETHHAS